eukprot:gnl/Spiro4/8907_TR4705_c0_g1_i1.p1 gnl/Spiro4/8907_TR4705_c0_g1~~gnl/Spiro4/8907_TR4705_c0_g1_i1.p1  ORF type:complete len:195 (-),score=20.27 gnl/Spiro4/8907_TR4705_c0_g1_i1:67-651(-)
MSGASEEKWAYAWAHVKCPSRLDTSDMALRERIHAFNHNELGGFLDFLRVVKSCTSGAELVKHLDGVSPCAESFGPEIAQFRARLVSQCRDQQVQSLLRMATELLQQSSTLLLIPFNITTDHVGGGGASCDWDVNLVAVERIQSGAPAMAAPTLVWMAMLDQPAGSSKPHKYQSDHTFVKCRRPGCGQWHLHMS